jgi:hypothetical protein
LKSLDSSSRGHIVERICNEVHGHLHSGLTGCPSQLYHLSHVNKMLSMVSLEAAGAAGFWSQWMSSRDPPSLVPLSRFDVDAAYVPDVKGSRAGIYCRFGIFIEDISGFDTGTFRLPRAEALALDPHARLLLEHTQVIVSLLNECTSWCSGQWSRVQIHDVLCMQQNHSVFFVLSSLRIHICGSVYTFTVSRTDTDEPYNRNNKQQWIADSCQSQKERK